MFPALACVSRFPKSVVPTGLQFFFECDLKHRLKPSLLRGELGLSHGKCWWWRWLITIMCDIWEALSTNQWVCFFFWRDHGWWWLILGFYQPLRDALWKNHWRFWELMGTASKLSQVPKVRLLWKWALRLGSAARRSCLGQSGSWVLVLVYFDEKHSNKYVNV